MKTVLTEEELDNIILDAYLIRAGKVLGRNYVRGFLEGMEYAKMKYSDMTSEELD
jgi:hypothetical protein